MMNDSDCQQVVRFVIDALDLGLAPAGQPMINMLPLAVVGKFMHTIVPGPLNFGEKAHSR